MPSPGQRRVTAHGSVTASVVGPVVLARRRVLAGLAGLPAALVLGACTSGDRRPRPSGSATGTGGPAPTSTTDPQVDAAALESAAAAALALQATYAATVTAHPALAPVLAPFAADHDAHLEALAERVTLPTSSPASVVSPTTTVPTAGPSDDPTAGSASAGSTIPADPAAARTALVRAEDLAGEEARAAASSAGSGEPARLLASIGASRAVHAFLLGRPT